MSETTYIDEANVHQCNNCGAFAGAIKDINHYPACQPGEAKKWEHFYNDTNHEETG